MARPRAGLLITVLSCLSLVDGLAQGNHPTRDFMRQKLNYSQGILEGMTLEKYGLVVSNATLLRNMNLTNAFVELRNPEFAGRIANFQGKVDKVIQAAKAEKLEKCTQAYSQVVASCVDCHKQFRREQFLKRQVK